MNKRADLGRIWSFLNTPISLRVKPAAALISAEIHDWRHQQTPERVAFYRQQHELIISLSLVMSVFTLLELLFEQHPEYDIPYVLSVVLSGAFLVCAVLTWRGFQRISSYLLPLILAVFVGIQISRHTGISWAFLLPPVVLFLHPLRRGLQLLAGITILVLLIVMGAHTQIMLRDEQAFEFIVSMLILLVVCAVLVEQLHGSLAAVATAAFREPLTGLYRRDIFNEFFAKHLRMVQRARGSFALLMFDIDNFKAVNDIRGHGAGDELLRRVGEVLRGNLRAGDIAARFGGDEFLLLLADCPGNKAVEAANRLRLQINALNAPGGAGDSCRISASAGIALYPADGSTVEALFEAADQRLLTAKRSGRDRVIMAAGRDA